MHHPLGDQRHDIPPPADRSHLEPVGDRLGEGRQVRRHAKQPLRPSRPNAEPGDHLVEHQHRAVLRARLAHPFEIPRPRQDRALVAHDRLHDHARHIAPLQPRRQRCQVIPRQHLDLLDRRLLPLAPRHRSARPRRRRRRPQDVVEPPVVMPLELDDHAPPGMRPRQPQRALHRLAARRAESHQIGARHHFAKQPRRLRLRPGLPAIQQPLLHLRRRRLDHIARRMTQDHRPQTEVIIDQPVAIGIEQIRPVRPLEHQRRRLHAKAEIGRHAPCQPLGCLGDPTPALVKRQRPLRPVAPLDCRHIGGNHLRRLPYPSLCGYAHA